MNLEKKFEKMGARVKVREAVTTTGRRGFDNSKTFRVDVRKDREGTFFDLLVGKAVDVEVLDVKSDDRHLLLLAKTPDENVHRPDIKSKFLCGHDERDWFVAAIPEAKTSVASVQAAKQALKPTSVVEAEDKVGVKPSKRQKRKNEARKRQGEWFFIPAPSVKVDEKLILKNEPLRRGRGKPHMAEELYRIGGETVWVGLGATNGISVAAYSKLSSEERKNKRSMSRNPRVYVRGKIRHSDHKTIQLDGWHLVQMNTETESIAMRSVAFLD